MKNSHWYALSHGQKCTKMLNSRTLFNDQRIYQLKSNLIVIIFPSQSKSFFWNFEKRNNSISHSFCNLLLTDSLSHYRYPRDVTSSGSYSMLRTSICLLSYHISSLNSLHKHHRIFFLSMIETKLCEGYHTFSIFLLSSSW